MPERLELKRAVLAEIDAAAPPETVIASSTSGLLPSDMQRDLARPGRMLVGHPFNPVYLLPLVEIVGGRATDAAMVERAGAVYESIGMRPVVVRKEIDAFIGDRLQEALWREALWLVHDGIATVEEIDDVIRYSFGLRWAQMGVFQVYRVAGGEAGLRHFMEQFGAVPEVAVGRSSPTCPTSMTRWSTESPDSPTHRPAASRSGSSSESATTT